MTQLLATLSPAARARSCAPGHGGSVLVQPDVVRSTTPNSHMWLGANGIPACATSVFHGTDMAKPTITGSLGEMT